MILETERLILRPFTMADLNAHQAAVYGDSLVTQYLPGGAPWALHETATLLAYWIEHQERHGFAPWAVIEKQSGAHLGHCGLMHIPRAPDGAVELMYALAKPAWGVGYASEAAAASIRFGFETVGLDEIIAVAIPENESSRRVMEKIGMHYAATDDRYYGVDLARYAITRAQFQPGGGVYLIRESN